MSYNIDSIDYLNGLLEIKETDRRALIKELQYVPELCFLRDMGEDDEDEETEEDEDEKPKDPEGPEIWKAIDRLSWSGEASGWAYRELLTKVLPKTRGIAEFSIIWEGGDTTGGLKVVNGRVTEHELVMSLGEQK